MMHWEKAEGNKTIDPKAWYLVKTNGGEWRDGDLYVMWGSLVISHLRPDFVRGRPVWIAKITEPEELGHNLEGV